MNFVFARCAKLLLTCDNFAVSMGSGSLGVGVLFAKPCVSPLVELKTILLCKSRQGSTNAIGTTTEMMTDFV